MGISYQASLEVGGSISKRQLDALWKLINGKGIGPDWSDGFESREQFDRFVEDRDSTLMLTCNYASLETYQGVREWCRKVGCSYYLREDAVAEGGENVSWWQPDMDEEKDCWGHEGRAVIPVEDLLKCKKMRDFVDLVKRYTPCDIPDFDVAP